jgi:hypothetical protein
MQQGTYLKANDRSVNQEIPNFYGIQQIIIMFTEHTTLKLCVTTCYSFMVIGY